MSRPFLTHTLRGIKHGFAAVLFLVSLTTLLHRSHWLEPLTAQSMRVVHRIEAGALAAGLGPLQDWDAIAPKWATRLAAFQPGNTAAPKVSILRFTPQGYRDVFGGVSPIPRAAMAVVLTAIADELGKASLRVRPVIGIDVDITVVPRTTAVVPATCGPDRPPSTVAAAAQDDCAQNMLLSALHLLTRHASVIAVATPRARQERRPSQEPNDDIARQDASLQRLCTDDRVDFATPVTFVEPGEPHYRFLRLAKGLDKAETYDGAVFPSLGNLMALEACRQTTACDGLDIRPIAAAKASLGLCSSFRVPPPGREFPRNEIENGVYRPEQDFHWSLLDLLRTSVQTPAREVSTLEQARIEIRELTEGWKELGRDSVRPMLIIAINDGYSDKHYTVRDRTQPTDGDLLHAATALSMLQPLQGHEGKTLWKSALYDLVLGLVYLSIWVPLTYGIKSMWSTGRPMLAGLVTMIAPALLGVGLAMVSMLRSANLLHHDPPVWEDPVLILIGMTLHAYVTTWEVGDAAHEAAGGAAPAIETGNRSLTARSAVIRRPVRAGLRGSRHPDRKAFRVVPRRASFRSKRQMAAKKHGARTQSDLCLAQGVAWARWATIAFAIAVVAGL